MQVVIAGMGDTGTLAATLLSKRHDVVGISTKPLFVSGQELGARLAQPDLWRRDHRHEFGALRRLAGVEVVHGAVSSLDLAGRSLDVSLASGGRRSVPYDALVLATGATNGFWRSAEVLDHEALDQAEAARARLMGSAGTVAVVGGGPSGVNAASQLVATRPDLDVRLYFSGDVPLPGYHPRTRETVVRHLARLGVGLHPGHRAIVPPGAESELGAATVQWSTGQAPVHADVVLWATGRVRPNTTTLPAELLDEDGFVQVAPTFEVPGHPGVFGIGDVAATDPLRSSARNFGHRLLARNVQARLSGHPERMREYRPPRHRWGSVLGLHHDGMRIFTPRGLAVRVPRRAADRVLLPLLTHRLIYGGVDQPGDDPTPD